MEAKDFLTKYEIYVNAWHDAKYHGSIHFNNKYEKIADEFEALFKELNLPNKPEFIHFNTIKRWMGENGNKIESLLKETKRK